MVRNRILRLPLFVHLISNSVTISTVWVLLTHNFARWIPLPIAIQATISGVAQYLSSHGQNRHLEEIGAVRAIPPFPENATDIETFIDDDSSRYIWIISDCVDYGSFSSPDGHERWLNALLKRKAEGADIRILVCGQAEAFTRVNKLRAMTFDQIRKTAAFKRYFRAHRALTKPSSKDELVAALMKQQAEIESLLLDKGIPVGHLPNERVGTFVWGKDRSEVLIIPADGDTEGHGFKITNPLIAQSFRTTFEKLWEKLPDAEKAKGRRWRLRFPHRLDQRTRRNSVRG